MTTSGMHYHNSLRNSCSDHAYQPSTEIISEPLSNKYTIGENIGRGKFAVVKKCVHNETQEEVAAKVIKKRRRGKSCRDDILREVVMLEMALDHPRLVNLKEVYETQSELILITEYCAGGELFTECVLEEKFNEADVRLLLQQILEGLVYLHEKFIVHLDLKPQNILLTKPFPEGSIKICDLGFACLVNTGEDIRDIIGTPDYVAPEVLNYDCLGLYTDMWSLGVLTYVMLTTCSPFAGDDKQQTFCNITMVKLDFPDDLFGVISPEARDFITKLLIADPSERLTAKECQQHTWICAISAPSSGVLLDAGTGEGTSLIQPVSTTAHSRLGISDRDPTLVPTSLRNSIEPGTNGLQQSSVPGLIVNSIGQGTSDGLHKSINLEQCMQMNSLNKTKHSVPAVGENITQLETLTPGAIVSDYRIDSELETTNRRPVHLSEMSIGEGTDVDSVRNEPVDLGTSVDLCKTSDSVFILSDSGTNVDQNQSDSDANFDLISSKDSELADSGMWSKSVSEGETTDNPMTTSLTQSEMEISKDEESTGRSKCRETYGDGDVVMDKHDDKSDNIEIMDIEGFNKSAAENDVKVNIVKLNDTNVNNSCRGGIPSPGTTQSHGQSGTIHLRDADMTSASMHELVERDNRSRSSLGTISENVDVINIYPTDTRNKRGMSNDTSPITISKSESTEEEMYEFISVSKRVRSLEESYSTIKSPQFSPKSPRSPRVGRHSQRSSHYHNSSK